MPEREGAGQSEVELGCALPAAREETLAEALALIQYHSCMCALPEFPSLSRGSLTYPVQLARRVDDALRTRRIPCTYSYTMTYELRVLQFNSSLYVAEPSAWRPLASAKPAPRLNLALRAGGSRTDPGGDGGSERSVTV